MTPYRALPLALLVSISACAPAHAGPPTTRTARPANATEPSGAPEAERVTALADLDPVWMRRTRIAGLYDGSQVVRRQRMGSSTGPATDENSDFLLITLGNRDGSQGADRDRDGLSDEAEVAMGLNPDAFDTDGDTIPDAFELFGTGTRAELADSDDDGTPDNEELDLDALAIYSDTDGDGLRNGQESASFGSDPTSGDSDADGFGDDYEFYFWTAMNDASDPDMDADDDGQPDDFEMANGFDPNDANSHEPDTDGDALPDFADADDMETYAWVAGHGGAVAAAAINTCNGLNAMPGESCPAPN